MGDSYHMSVLFLGFRLLPKLHAAATWLHAHGTAFNGKFVQKAGVNPRRPPMSNFIQTLVMNPA